MNFSTGRHIGIRFGAPERAAVVLTLIIGVTACGDQAASIPTNAAPASPSAPGSASPAAPTSSAAVLISGSPPTRVAAGSPYSFIPSAAATNGAALTFSVTNQPKWASFNTATGQLAGTPGPTDLGTYQNIVVAAVANGAGTAQLPAFSISVQQSGATSVTLTWTPPTENTDGSALTDLAGYHIYYGASATALNHAIDLGNAQAVNYLVSGLSAGTWYFAVAAYDSAGVEGTASGTTSATI